MPPMFKKIPSNKLFVSEPNPAWFGNPANPARGSGPGWTNANWLKSRFHFAFAEYNSSANDSFGCLRVMNDDLVQPGRGFGTHGHANMEICTYIVEGKLTHADSTGTEETLGRGAVQFMTAGAGVRHSEHNLDNANPLRFIQMWIVPTQSGLKPNYGSAVTEPAERHNRWCHVVGSVNGAKASAAPAPKILINQDANLFITELDAGKELELHVEADRQAYFLCMEGAAGVAGSDGTATNLDRHDAMEIYGGGASVKLTAGGEGAHCLVVEMGAVPGSGRKDV